MDSLAAELSYTRERLGYATPKAIGESAGGLLIPATAFRRPNLLAAVVTRVGVVDPDTPRCREQRSRPVGGVSDPTT